MKNRAKLLILGNARHGKDTFAEILRDKFGMTFQSSSQAAADIFIYDELKVKFGYETPEECFNDRHNHRPLWHQMISDYNSPDKAKLAKGILENNDCYVGMRSHLEIDECMNQKLFDIIIWVDASDRLPLEASNSFNIDMSCADIILENNGTYEEFEEKVVRLGRILFQMEPIDKDFNILFTFRRYATDINNELLGFSALKEKCFIDGWPNVKDEDGDIEPLDLENVEILSLDENTIVINAGGDWQPPHKVTIKENALGLYVESYEPCVFKDGLTTDEIREILWVTTYSEK